jgi:hypothetical protein
MTLAPDANFRKALLCVLECNQLSSKIIDEMLKTRGQEVPSAMGGLASGFFRIASRVEALATGKDPERLGWSTEEKEALSSLLSSIKDAGQGSDQSRKVEYLFFPEGLPNG